MSSNDSRICWRGIVANRAEASPLLASACDAVLVERGRPRLLVLQCPCGCGEALPINLDPRAGPAWRIYRSVRGLSLYPSVWRESGCESHFVIWRDEIILFGRYRGAHEEPDAEEQETRLRGEVLTWLPSEGVVPYAEIADALDAVPWDVLSVCRKLVKQGEAYEASGERRGYFGRHRPR
jgi:hypothetical protein